MSPHEIERRYSAHTKGVDARRSKGEGIGQAGRDKIGSCRNRVQQHADQEDLHMLIAGFHDGRKARGGPI